MEYLDGGVWAPTSSNTLKSAKGVTMEATYVLLKQNTAVNVKETATFKTAVADGTLKFRIKCAAGEYTVNSAKAATQAGKSSTIRIRQWSDGSCDAIKIKIEK